MNHTLHNSIVTVRTDIESIVDETVQLINEVATDFSRKLKLFKVSYYDSVNEKLIKMEENVARINSERTNDHVNFSQELDEMRIRLDELDDKVNPDTDPVLESILGPQFPINRPAAHSVKDYVDTHIGKMKTTLFHHQKNLAKQQDVDALRKEMSEFMNYVSSEYTKTFAQIYKETKQQNSPHMRIPPTLHNSVMREPHLPDDPNPFHDVSTISPITPHKNETNPFMTSDVILLLTAPADNPAYQPIITIPPQFNSTLPATAPNTVIYQSVGNIPIPKFRPYLETPENFLKEVELYMKRKRVMPEDWILMLPSVFKQDKHQSLWWQSTKLVVNSWDDFKSEFLQMYGSEMDKHQSVERLLNRRQKKNEPFNKFALEMNMIYRKIFKIDQSSHDTQIIQFVAERALPHIQTALLSCRAKNLVELINFGKIFEKSTPPEQTTKLASSHTNQATVRDGNRNPPPPPPPRQNYNNNNNPAPRPPQRQNNNNTPPRPPPRQNNNNRPRCANCPHLNNHNIQNCFRNVHREAAQVNVAQHDGQGSGNGTIE